MSHIILSLANSGAPPVPDTSSFEAVSARFLSLFPVRHDSAIKRDQGCWRTTSRFHYLSDGEILQSLQGQSDLQRGCRFDTTTRFAAIQIPPGSSYYKAEGLAYIRSALGEIGPNLKIFQYAEDRYLYIFFSESISSANILSALSARLTNVGIIVSPSTLLIHPADNAIPFPLQPGFAWLNFDAQVIMRREEISLESALSFFLSDFDKNSISQTLFFRALTTDPRQDEQSSPSMELKDQSVIFSDLPVSEPAALREELDEQCDGSSPKVLIVADEKLAPVCTPPFFQLLLPLDVTQHPSEQPAQDKKIDTRGPPQAAPRRISIKNRSPDLQKARGGSS